MARPTVKLTDSASLKGVLEYARGSRKPIRAFLGIPYAVPPVGHLRFQPPQSGELWKGERDASTFGPICSQNIKKAIKTYAPFQVPENTSEDCLYLNIWSPSQDGEDHNAALPVMMWIHGGGYIQGFSNMYIGTALCSYHDVVFVSINYRLGPFGFMCTGDGVVKGNMGLLDQVQALRWLKQHVSKFGGDPSNITVFGESAGGIFSALHAISPLTSGLVRRAICQSGVSTYPSVIWPPQNSRKYLMKKLQQWGFTGSSGHEIIQFLSTKSSQETVARLGDGFNPTIDGDYLTELPQRSLASGNFHKIELMLGFNTHEGIGFIQEMARSKQIKSYDVAVRIVEETVKVRFFRGNLNGAAIVSAIIDEYMLRDKQDKAEELTEAIVNMYGDILFALPSVRLAKIHSAVAPTFLYKFDQRPSFSPHPDWVGADHGHEIPFALGEPFLERLPDIWPDDEKQLSQLMMTYWTNFAKTGNPNSLRLTEWPHYAAGTEPYMRLADGGATVCWKHQPAKAHFWNVTVPALATKPVPKY